MSAFCCTSQFWSPGRYQSREEPIRLIEAEFPPESGYFARRYRPRLRTLAATVFVVSTIRRPLRFINRRWPQPRRIRRFSLDGKAVLGRSCRPIVAAKSDKEKHAINGQALTTGSLADAIGVPTCVVRYELRRAARQVTSFNPRSRRHWRHGGRRAKVDRRLDAGLHRPREVRCV